MTPTAPLLVGDHRTAGRSLGSRPVATLRWRALRDDARSGAENMAVDHALARCLGEGEAVLRLYRWARPTVSFGRNEPTLGLYSVPAARRLGVDYVRRPTGGRAVLHDREVTYAILARPEALGGPRAAYGTINAALATALRRLGADVEVSRSGVALAPDAGPCFREAARGEIVARGRKLVGSAQARLEGVLLQHGSIVLAGDQSRLDTLACREVDTDGSIGLADLIGPVGFDDVAEVVTSSLAEALGGVWGEGGVTTEERDGAIELAEGTYGKDSWTWRR